MQLSFNAEIGNMNSPQTLPFRLTLDVAKGMGLIALKGFLSQFDHGMGFNGFIELSGADAIALIQRLAEAADILIPKVPNLGQEFTLQSEVNATDKVVGLNNLEIKLGETTIIK